MSAQHSLWNKTYTFLNSSLRASQPENWLYDSTTPGLLEDTFNVLYDTLMTQNPGIADVTVNATVPNITCGYVTDAVVMEVGTPHGPRIHVNATQGQYHFEFVVDMPTNSTEPQVQEDDPPVAPSTLIAHTISCPR